MKSSMESVNSVQKRVSVEVTPEEVDKAFTAALKGLQKKAKVQGFRPGKAPLNIVKKLYGGQVLAEVGDKLINGHMFAALTEQEIRPISSPVIESADTPEQGKAFTFKALVDIMPALEFDDYKGLEVKADSYTVDTSMIDKEINQLQRRQAKTTPVEDNTTAAAAGMLATVSHTASLDGNKIDQMDINDMPVNLGAGELYEDLENAILGMKTGETKETDITLPKDFGDDELSGKTLKFHIELKELKNLELPEVNDDFAKDLNFESVADLKEKVQNHMESRAKDLSRQNKENAILEAILAKHDFEVPPAMVDQVIDSMIGELQHPSENERKVALENQEMRKHFRDQAKKRTQNTLVLWHVSQKEELKVTDEDVEAKLGETLAQFGGQMGPQVAQIKKNLEPRIRENLIFEKAMDFLLSSANINENKASLPM